MLGIRFTRIHDSICVHFGPYVVHLNSTSSIYTSFLSSFERSKCTQSSKVRGIARAHTHTHMVHLPFYHLRPVRRLHSLAVIGKSHLELRGRWRVREREQESKAFDDNDIVPQCTSSVLAMRSYNGRKSHVL